MARVVALIGDLLFGSQVQGALVAAGEELELVGNATRAREHLADKTAGEVAVLVVDLLDESLGGAALVEQLVAEGTLGNTRTLGFYAHVDAHVRERAEQVGFDLAVPRSRMAREGATLVARLARHRKGGFS
jgi:DNA-binding NarL/FixJ family response regulator